VALLEKLPHHETPRVEQNTHTEPLATLSTLEPSEQLTMGAAQNFLGERGHWPMAPRHPVIREPGEPEYKTILETLPDGRDRAEESYSWFVYLQQSRCK